ncbi:MAG: GH3 auxin-responsive promoter family protein [Thermoanaerobaculia bacterium]|nr:GH3 auxin-responsive promoter family protein [Thermoanaerobaculia bacterium]
MGSLSAALWWLSSLPEAMRFRAALGSPREVQERLLKATLRRNRDTAFGRAAGFASVRNSDDYRKRIPIRSWEELSPWANRVAWGESNVLTRSPVRVLQPTGGSTAGAKLIPFTRELSREFRAGVAPWLVDLARRYPAVRTGSAYWSLSPVEPGVRGFTTDAEALGGTWSRLIGRACVVPSVVRFAPDLASFRYLTLLYLLRRRDLAFVSVWHPSFLTALLDSLPDALGTLLADIARGGCSVVRELCGRPLPYLPPLPARAAELRASRIEEPRSLWPRLAVVSCWGDGHSALALDQLRGRLRGMTVQPKGLLATEAVVTVPFAGLRPIAIRSHFFEFLPEGETERSCRVDELEAGVRYSVVVTTGGGLYRYRLDDVVEVEGAVGATPALRFLGRGGCVSDLRGEKLAEAFVARAVAGAFRSIGLVPSFVLLAPAKGSSSLEERERSAHYELFFDSARAAEPADFPLLEGAAESELSRNPQYRAARSLGQLGPVKAHFVPGSEAAYLERCLAGGQRLGEIKSLALSPHSDWGAFFASLAPRL